MLNYSCESAISVMLPLQRPKCPQKCECCECEYQKEDQVCGVDGNSYRNACAAKCNGVVSYYFQTW